MLLHKNSDCRCRQTFLYHWGSPAFRPRKEINEYSSLSFMRKLDFVGFFFSGGSGTYFIVPHDVIIAGQILEFPKSIFWNVSLNIKIFRLFIFLLVFMINMSLSFETIGECSWAPHLLTRHLPNGYLQVSSVDAPQTIQ